MFSVFEFLRRHSRLKGWLLACLNWYQQVFAISPLKWPRLPGELIHFLASYRQYQGMKSNEERISIYPILFQRGSMPFDAQYMYQAAWATRRIKSIEPAEHIDISSDLRFVSQLSAHVPVIYVEYRPMDIMLEGLQVRQGNILQLPFADQSCTSISCLHVVEHIGLGRYGDPIDPKGTVKALAELERVVASGGSLFLSLPIGRPRTLFNAHRITDPNSVSSLVPTLDLVEFSVVTTKGKFIQNSAPDEFVDEEYACGLYWFRRNRDEA